MGTTRWDYVTNREMKRALRQVDDYLISYVSADIMNSMQLDGPDPTNVVAPRLNELLGVTVSYKHCTGPEKGAPAGWSVHKVTVNYGSRKRKLLYLLFTGADRESTVKILGRSNSLEIASREPPNERFTDFPCVQNDFRCRMKCMNIATLQPFATFPGEKAVVHSGFYDRMQSMNFDELAPWLARFPNRELVITGHGMDGSTAILFYYWLWAELCPPDMHGILSRKVPPRVVTLGAPLVFKYVPFGFRLLKERILNIIHGFDALPRILGGGEHTFYDTLQEEVARDFLRNSLDVSLPKLQHDSVDYVPFGTFAYGRLEVGVIEMIDVRDWKVFHDWWLHAETTNKLLRHNRIYKYKEMVWRSLARLLNNVCELASARGYCSNEEYERRCWRLCLHRCVAISV